MKSPRVNGLELDTRISTTDSKGAFEKMDLAESFPRRKDKQVTSPGAFPGKSDFNLNIALT